VDIQRIFVLLVVSRVFEGGRKPLLGKLEEILVDEILEMRISKMKVTDLQRSQMSSYEERRIRMVVIPGGLTYLQAGDLGMFQRFKD
jgi:hypothetical protein